MYRCGDCDSEDKKYERMDLRSLLYIRGLGEVRNYLDYRIQKNEAGTLLRVHRDRASVLAEIARKGSTVRRTVWGG